MPRKENKTVPEGNDGPVPQQEQFGPGQPTLVDLYRLFKRKTQKGAERKYEPSFLYKMKVLSR